LTLLIGPLVAVIGVVAATIVIRARARTRRSLYASLRADRERRIREAKDHALAPRSRPGAPITTGTPISVGRPALAAPALATSSAAAAAFGLSSRPGNRSPATQAPSAAGPRRPRLAHRALSVAGLAAALLVVLLGVILMIEAGSH
jgi:hypothetical protein